MFRGFVSSRTESYSFGPRESRIKVLFCDSSLRKHSGCLVESSGHNLLSRCLSTKSINNFLVTNHPSIGNMKNKNIFQSWLPIGDFPVCSITIIKTLLLLACLSYLATAFKKLPTRFKSRSFTTTMGCTESKPEVVDTSIETCYLMPDIALRTAIEEGKVDWTEKLHKFSTDALDATGAEINMIGKPKEFRNVISWTPKACEIALNAGEVSKIPVRGVVLICHGILAHGNSHAREAVEFARAGYAVYSLDYYGTCVFTCLRVYLPHIQYTIYNIQYTLLLTRHT